MRNIQQHLCHVIPPHILRHIAEDAEPAAADVRESAQATLDHMRTLTGDRTANVIADHAAPIKGKKRNVYDARHTETLPGKLVMNEHRRRGADVEVNEAYDGCGTTYDFFSSIFTRNSIDGRGMRLDSSVHYGRRFDNAFWNGRQMVYGDGDAKVFTRFTAAIDVIAHELTHGLTQFAAGLGYTGQTGALNEHISDAFGIMVKQHDLGITAGESDWIIGEGLFAPGIRGKGIRSMAAPGTAYDDPILGRDPQPAHMRDYVQTPDDNGGVHINSGIPNRAFYLAAVALGGETWGVMARIWYETLTSPISAGAGFQAFADATSTMARDLYGRDSGIPAKVAEAWDAVGLTPVVKAAVKTRQGLPPMNLRRATPAAAGGGKWRDRP